MKNELEVLELSKLILLYMVYIVYFGRGIMELKEFVHQIEKERTIQYYYDFLKHLEANKTLTFKDIIGLKEIPNRRSILIRLVKLGALHKIKTQKGTRYIFTSTTKKLLELIENELSKFDKLVKPKVLTMSNMEWVIRTIIKIRDEGYTEFNKGLFFKKFYELIEELERKGYVFTRPKIVSIDRCLRMAVTLGYLERRGTKQKPIYIINESKLLELMVKR